MKKLIVFVDKPSVSRLIYQNIEKYYHDVDIYFIHLHPYMNPKFVYPKGIKYKQYPLVQEIRTKNDLNILQNKRIIREDNKILLADFIMTDIILDSCTEILYMGDPDYSSAIAFSLFVDNQYKDKSLPIIYSTKLYKLDSDSIDKSLTEIVLFDDGYKEIVNYGLVKKYFDYNWNLNSLVLLNSYYQKVYNKEVAWISKYELQLLYFIKDNKLSESLLIDRMSDWEGTGKYSEKMSLGSAASRCQMITNLIKNDLVKVEERVVQLTSDGLVFLNNLHKDVRDIDLPYRIHHWCLDGLHCSKPKIDKYIKTFFGKIK